LHVLTNTHTYFRSVGERQDEREAKKEKEIEVKQERKGKQPRYEREREGSLSVRGMAEHGGSLC